MSQTKPLWPQSPQTLSDLLLAELAQRLTPALTEEQHEEYFRCKTDYAHFIREHIQIYDATSKDWIPFDLWPAQIETLDVLHQEKLVIILKARQIGFTWLALAFALWLMLFHPAATVLLFSKGDDEAVDLLDFRLKGMYERLPATLRVPTQPVATDHKHEWLLGNGSRALAFSTKRGRSYTASFVLVDEAEFVPDLAGLLNAVKPTVDAGGQLVLLSTPDKGKPLSPFKRIYQAAKQKLNLYAAVFHSWRARPGRDDAWYEAQRRSVLAETGALDDLHQEYPATDAEALSARTLDKRIPAAWLEMCYAEAAPFELLPVHARGGPYIAGLQVYKLPVFGLRYKIGGDPAEGNPNSDDSALSVVDSATGEEVATLAGKYEPVVFAGHLAALSRFYNRADVLPERNNHGHAVILELQQNYPDVTILPGHDGKPGYLTTPTSKIALYDTLATALMQRDALLHSLETYTQLASIEASTLNAPEGMPDDRAMCFALGIQARATPSSSGGQFNYMGQSGRAAVRNGMDEEEY